MGDDVPYLVDTPHGRLMELPIQWINDDAPHYSRTTGISSQEKVLEIWRAEFEGYHRYGGCYVLNPAEAALHIGGYRAESLRVVTEDADENG